MINNLKIYDVKNSEVILCECMYLTMAFIADIIICLGVLFVSFMRKTKLQQKHVYLKVY